MSDPRQGWGRRAERGHAALLQRTYVQTHRPPRIGKSRGICKIFPHLEEIVRIAFGMEGLLLGCGLGVYAAENHAPGRGFGLWRLVGTRQKAGLAPKDVKNAGRSGDVYENKGEADTMTDNKSVISAQLRNNSVTYWPNMQIFRNNLARGDSEFQVTQCAKGPMTR
jgi:hypothetical protein